MTRRAHVVGAGLAGLSAAVRLAEMGAEVVLHEATSHAGGRCRSFDDPRLGRRIDNGNHLLLSGNDAALRFVETIGARERLSGPASARFDFADLASGERWTLDMGQGLSPLWAFDPSRRAPGTRARDHLALARLLRGGDRRVDDLVLCSGPIYERLLEPMLVACLNDDPAQSSARLAAAVVRGSVARGGRACRPLIAHDGLSSAFVDPALDRLAAKGAEIRFNRRLDGIDLDARRARALVFGGERLPLGLEDVLILAAPAEDARRLLPGLDAPSEHRAIVNLHFLVEEPHRLPPLLGVIHGLTQWIFAFAGRLAVTISNAGEVLRVPSDELAAHVWGEVAKLANLPAALPPWRVIRERRATFAARPEQDRRRPPARTRWANIFLAGDWTATGLPATIEGAVRSGDSAARLAYA